MSNNYKHVPSAIFSIDRDHVVEIPLQVTIPVDAEFRAAIADVLNAPDEMSFCELTKFSGLDPLTDFTGVDLMDTDFLDATDFFTGANLRTTAFNNSRFGPDVSFEGALLEGANFTGATGLTEEQLACAYTNGATVFPDYIDPARVRYLHGEKKMPPPPPITGNEGMITFTVPATLHRKM